MRPPLTLDIGWSDLLFGVRSCALARDADRHAARVESSWSTAGDAVAGLTVRTLFDAWLRARAFAPGDEILFTGFTLPDMARVARENGLVPVPVDVDPLTMSPTAAELDALRTARTRAVVIAHLFGGRVDLTHIVAWAAERGVDVAEDAAQAYAADGWKGSPDVAISLFSFGTIKTATALGGAVANVPDQCVRQAIRALLADAPRQTRAEVLRGLLRASALRVVGARPIYGGFVRACRLAGWNHEAVLRRAARSIRGTDFITAIRRRPSAPLLALLARRLGRPPTDQIARRAARGEAVLRRIEASVVVPGSAMPVRTHWILPVCVDDRTNVIARLRAAGFDPAPAGSVAVIGDAPRLRAMEERLIYVPIFPELSDADVDRIAAAIL